MQQNEQSIFNTLVALVGHTVEVGRHSNAGKAITGIVTNAMFDSFILCIGGKNQIIPFSDIAYLSRSK